jgi:hypothetical protein
VAVSSTQSRRRRHTQSSSLGRIGLAAAYLLPALIIAVVGVARPSLSNAAVTCVDNVGTTTCEFTSSGPSSQQWTVPAGVDEITMTVAGGQGGGNLGGEGAQIVADLEVSAGEMLSIFVGEWGTAPGGTPTTTVGGGGAGGERSGAAFGAQTGGGGGGATRVVLLGEVEIELAVAGGGGGQSAPASGGTAFAGGDGGAVGLSGAGPAGSGGAGGTADDAGSGGAPAAPPDCALSTPGGAGTAGLAAAGGAGGAGFAGGGGGGGGWFGGGGGAGAWVCTPADPTWGGGAGGGGGSSYADTDRLIDPEITPGVNGGEGYVTISFATPDVDPPAGTGYLEATLATGDSAAVGDVDLTALGATDWAIWGYGLEGTSTSFAPDVSKSGGASIGNLEGITGSLGDADLRGLGQFDAPGEVPWRFDWSNGDTVPSAGSAIAGLQWDGGEAGQGQDLVGYGFRFTVPAGTSPQRLHVYTHAHGSEGTLEAWLSDDPDHPLTHSYINGSDPYNVPGHYTIDFAAASNGQTLTVEYTMTVRINPDVNPNGITANPAIYAVALAPQLVENGGFEQPSIPDIDFVPLLNGSDALTGWDIGLDGVDHVRDHWQPADGLQSVDLGSNNPDGDADGDGAISQAVATTPGQHYLLSFAYSANPDAETDDPPATAQVRWDGELITTLTPERPGLIDMGWRPAEVVVVGTEDSASTELEFTQTSGGVFGVALDDVSVIPIGGGDVPVEVDAPIMLRATPIDGDTTFVVAMTPDPGSYDLAFLSSDSCDGGVLGGDATEIGGFTVTTTEAEPYVVGSFDHSAAAGDYLAVQVAGPGDVSSDVSGCVAIQPGNDSWPAALPLSLTPGGASTSGYVDSEGNARWFKFSITPGARVTIDLTGLPKDYDLFLFKDIAQAYDDLTTVADLTRISAEFAPSAFAPSAFAPSAFAPSAFAPSAFAPSAFAPSAFAPSAFAPSAFAPSAFAPSAFAPSAFAPSAFAPSAFAPSAFAPSAFAPSAFAPSAFAPSAFASAQVRSLIGISALPGTGDEWIVADTWNNTGDFYVRVSGKNGEFDTTTPFSLDVSISDTECTGTIPALGTKPTAIDGDYETIVLTALDRMPATTAPDDENSASAKAAMLAALDGLPNAAIVDVNAYTTALHAFADTNYACPYYKNLVADAMKDVVDDYRALNPDLANIVLVGNDDVIPFFRYPDQSLLGPEVDFVPPVGMTTTSQGSLGSNMVLGQDEYGASTTISVRGATFPVPDLAVGRLVETATEVTGMVDAYLGTTGGVVPTPTSSLVTGYDFIADAADAIDVELTAGIGAQARRLVTPGDVAPHDDDSWTADELRRDFLEQRNDITFLGGHFSASGALAADFVTEMSTRELVDSTVDMENSIVFSIGCHSGYSIVDSHGVTETLDWAQAFAQKHVTLIAGTGYQYGDTDFIEYSERLYLEFAKQLRTGSGPVALGDALVAAKQAYLRSTPDIRGLHEKSLLEATLFGLPMLSVDMDGARLPDPSSMSEVGGTTGYTDGPGRTTDPVDDGGLDLQYADLTVDSTFGPSNTETRTLTNLDDPDDPVTTTFFTGPDGVTTNPLEPALPLDVRNVTVPDKVLRGIGFLGGTYDEDTLVPLTGAPNTEIRGVHIPFSSTVFYPIRPWTPNYFDALAGGSTNLLVTPVQHKSVALDDIDATARKFSSLNLRLFYSDNIQTYGTGDEATTPALAAPPTITSVSAEVDGTAVTFQAKVVGDPAAGIQEVWATYTGHENAFASVSLDQSATDSSLWIGEAILAAPLGAGDELKFMVQAVNGVGLVTVADDFGAFYTATVAGASAPTITASELSLAGSDESGDFGSTMDATATLTDTDGVPIAGKTIVFDLGGAVRLYTTGEDGVAQVEISITSTGQVPLRATFAGDAVTGASSASRTFDANPAATRLALEGPGALLLGEDASVIATLEYGPLTSPVYLTGKNIVFRITAPGGGQTFISRSTDIAGQARIEAPSSPSGSYTVHAFFGSAVTTPNGPVGGPDRDYEASSATGTYTVRAQKYAFSSRRDGNVEIYTMNPDGTGQTRRTNHSGIDTEASFSPDGKQIVFASTRTGLGDIYKMNVDGTGLVRLTTSTAIDGAPAWSPDGTKIAFTSRRNGNFEIYVMNANGSSQTRLTNNSAIDNEPEWSPNGAKISFTSTRTGAGDIYVMNANGSGVTRLTTHAAIDGTSAWSPDGTRIAFTSRRDGNFEIYVMNADGSGQTRRTNNSAIDTEPVWTVDGSKILFGSTRNGLGDIYAMNPDGTGVVRLTTHTAIDNSPAAG